MIGGTFVIFLLHAENTVLLIKKTQNYKFSCNCCDTKLSEYMQDNWFFKQKSSEHFWNIMLSTIKYCNVFNKYFTSNIIILEASRNEIVQFPRFEWVRKFDGLLLILWTPLGSRTCQVWKCLGTLLTYYAARQTWPQLLRKRLLYGIYVRSVSCVVQMTL